MSQTEKTAMAVSQSQSFGGTEVTSQADIASNAMAAHAKAMVESRYIMALRNPRNMDQVRQDLLRECTRPSFANNPSAFYRKPIGNGVEGLGIRFVEVALRCMKNVVIETKMVYENDAVEVHNVTVTDLESNITYPMDVKVSKTVERSKPADDGSYISVRKNSYNKLVYTVPATDDDLLNKRGSLISKAIRTLGLRIIPGDLQDEAEDTIKRIRQNQAAQDPEAERKKLVDAFGGLGVKASDLVAYLGHDLGSCSPAQIVELRGIYGAIREGEATWKSVMANKADSEAEAAGSNENADPKPEAKKPKPESATAKAAAAAKAQGDKVKPADPAPSDQPAETAPPAEQSQGHTERPPIDPEYIKQIEQYEKNMPGRSGNQTQGNPDPDDGQTGFNLE
jgi:hypothetical protein